MKDAFGRSRGLLGALALLLLGACAATGPQAFVWSPPAAWKMAQRNTGSYGKDMQLQMTRGDTTWNGAAAVTLAQSTGMKFIATPQGGRLHALLAPDGRPLISWDPPVGFDFPLQVGKAFKSRHRMTSHARGMVTDMEFSCTVPAYEKVTVPAGTFDAYKVTCTSAGTSEIYWLAPSVGIGVKTSFTRPEGSPFGAGTQQAELLEFRR
ncbi:MAG: hypothetical protein NDJ19_13370 [Ramlibacter sp.]|nr:hypothetical protein [Ramlibacter sp.]